MKGKHQLFYGTCLIGTIDFTNSDFPGFCGRIVVEMQANDGLSGRLLDYMRVSELISNLFEEPFNPNTEREKELYAEEAKYEDLINSNEWKLLSEEGEVTEILVPVFHKGNEITCRLNTT